MLRLVERATYRLIGVRETDEQRWTAYGFGVLAVSVVSTLVSFLLLGLQDHLPLNPQGLSAPSADFSLDTAVSFATNTELAELRRRADDVLPVAASSDRFARRRYPGEGSAGKAGRQSVPDC